MKKYFITGISTEVGKTIVSAILTEAMNADYWKPVQAGELNNSDSQKIKQLISNSKTTIHPESYALQTPASPHQAAEKEGVKIKTENIKEPETNNKLIIEGAGGLLVPLNNKHTIIDILKPDYKIIVVSRHYLGSINHTLLTIKWLQKKGFDISVIFNGDKQSATEKIIKKMTKCKVIGRINEEPFFDKNVVLKYAKKFEPLMV